MPTPQEIAINSTVLVYDDTNNIYQTGFLIYTTLPSNNFFVLTAQHGITSNNIFFKCIIQNVNSSGKSKSLIFDLIGYDVISDLAIGLYYPSKNDGFVLDPVLQDTLLFNLDPRSYTIGNAITYIGSIVDVEISSVSKGTVSDNHFGGFNDGIPIPESFLLDGFKFTSMEGSPVVDIDGNVVAMISRKASETNEYSPVIALSSSVMFVVWSDYYGEYFNLTPAQQNDYNFMTNFLKHGFNVTYTGVKINYLGTGLFKRYPELETLLPTLAPSEIPVYSSPDGQTINVVYVSTPSLQTICGMVIEDFIYALNLKTGELIYDPKQYINNYIVRLFNPFAQTQLFKNFYANSKKYPVLLLGVSYLDLYKSFPAKQDIYTTISIGKFYNQNTYGQFKYDSYWFGHGNWQTDANGNFLQTYYVPFTFYYVYFLNGNWVFNTEYVMPTTVTYFDAYKNAQIPLPIFDIPEPLWGLEQHFSLHEL